MNRENYEKAGELLGGIEQHSKALDNFKAVFDKGTQNPNEIRKVEMRGHLSPFVKGTSEGLGGYITIPRELVSEVLEQIRDYHVDNKIRLEKELEAL